MSIDNPITAYAPLPLAKESSAIPLASGTTKSREEIDAIARDFEAVFLSQMMAHMFSGDEANSYFGKGSTGEIYKSFLMNEYGKSIASAGGIGIADTVRQELLRMQEVTV